jgi:hypothetical protein
MRILQRRSLIAAGTILIMGCGSTGTGDETTAAGAGAAAGASTQSPAGTRVLGTIRATIAGTPRSWHVVAGPSQSRAYASGVWMEVGSSRMIVAGGFDTERPPLDTFTWDANGMPTSYGDYAGSTILVNLTVGANPAPFQLTFPPETTPAVMYSTRATLDSLNYTFSIEKGTVDVTSVSIANGLASASGTFAGTLKQLTGTDTIEVTDGSFDVSGLPDVATLR